PRRRLRGGAADAGHRGRRRGVSGEDRRARRLGGGDPVHAARDPGRRLPLPARGRGRRAHRRGRERVRHRRRDGPGALPRRPRRRRRPRRAPRALPRRSGRRSRAPRARRPGGGGPRADEPHAAHPRRGGGRRDARRDLRAAAGGVRRPPAVGDVLTARPRRAALLLALALTLTLPVAARAGVADRIGATFSLMAAGFVKAAQPLEALVIAVDGDTLYLDAGERAGAQVGQELTVYRKGDAFYHPITGKVLGHYETVLGYAQI